MGPNHAHCCLTAAQLGTLFLVFGCGKADPLVPVSGRVTYQDRPLETGAVVFIPDAEKGNTTKHEPRGTIDKGGGFEMVTAGKPGTPPGWYKVAIIATRPPSEKNPYAVMPSLIPRKYNDAKTSDLTVEVRDASSPGGYSFDLK